MTPASLAIALLVVALLVVQLTAVVYYLRHWGLRQERASSSQPRNEGKYFKRYVPPDLRPRYDRVRRRESRRRTIRMVALKTSMVLFVGGSSLAVTFLAARSAWPHLTWVDLGAHEIASLDYTEHRWVREPAGALPALEHVMPALRERGVALVRLRGGPKRSEGMAAVAAEQWQRFFARHRVPTRLCRSLERCGGGDIKVLLPGRWARGAIEAKLAGGEDLLLYGPPLQTVQQGRSFELAGLRFAPKRFLALPHLALVGDAILTLGFDAGLVLPIEPSFQGYAATSPAPQGVAMSASRFIGGDIQTRLYAAQAGRGRLVWMDFSPNVGDHYELIEERYFDGLVAAVFRYLLKREYTAWATWPEGRRFAGLLAVDAEDMFDRVESIAQVVREEQVPITWFVLSNEAQRHRDLLREIAAVGEIACHGDSHAAFPLVSARTQTVRIARCRKALATLAHAIPFAFRPPYEAYNDATVDAVANNRMTYFFAQAGGDRAVPSIERSLATGQTLVSLPRIGSDDFELWAKRRLDVRGSIEQADHEFGWARTLGGLLAFDFHTQFMTPDNLEVVRYYARRFRRDDVYLGTAFEIARWWRVRHRLTRGEAISVSEACHYRPVLLRVERGGRLERLTGADSIAAVLPGRSAARDDAWPDVARACGPWHQAAGEPGVERD